MTSTQIRVPPYVGPLHRRVSRSSTLPNGYQDVTCPRSSSNSNSNSNSSDYYEAHELSPLTPASSTTSFLPQYDTVVKHHASSASPSSSSSSTSVFRATHQFQVQSASHPLIAFPAPPKPAPILVYGVLPTGELTGPAYRSVRPERRSGSCVLFRGAGDGSDTYTGGFDDDDIWESSTPVCSTTYRFGPNRPPKIRLHAAASPTDGHEEEFTVGCVGNSTRAQNLRTHLGNLQWRYASRTERRAFNADSLLVCEKITTMTASSDGEDGTGGAGAKGGWRKSVLRSRAPRTVERRQRVAQLVRSAEFRSPGSSRTTAGNGGRLMVDLAPWADGKGDAAKLEALVVASCICRLKREVDRRRTHQIMAMSSGGP